MQPFLLSKVYSKLNSISITSHEVCLLFSVSDKVRNKKDTKVIVEENDLIIKQTIYEQFSFFKLLKQFTNFVVFFVSSCCNVSKTSIVFCLVFHILTGLVNGNQRRAE